MVFASVDNTPSGAATRHLVHRPSPWDGRTPLSSSASSPAEEEFLFSGELPFDDVMLNDGPGVFHDLQATAEVIRDVGELLGPCHFGVPSDRTGIFYRYAIALSDLAPWRTASGPGRLLATLAIRPDKIIDRVPRALEFRGTLRIDDVLCGTVSANLVFLAPVPRRTQRELSPATAPASATPRHAGVPEARVDPAEVGRADPENVLLRAPSAPANGRISSAVVLPPRWRRPTPAGAGHVPPLLLLEALRQASLLAAGRTYGLAPARSTLASLQVNFRGYAESGIPMRCATVSGPLGQDSGGRPLAPVTLTLTQAGRTVLEAVTTVAEDH